MAYVQMCHIEEMGFTKKAVKLLLKLPVIYKVFPVSSAFMICGLGFGKCSYLYEYLVTQTGLWRPLSVVL